MSLLGMATDLVEAEVRFVIVGGLAARAHGSARITEDLDICYDTDAENVRRLARILRGWEAYPRGVERGLPFVLDERAFRTTPIMTLITARGAIDVMDRVLGVGDYHDAFTRSVEVAYEDVRLRVLDLPALIAAKRATGRPKDRDQLPELEALLELREERPGESGTSTGSF